MLVTGSNHPLPHSPQQQYEKNDIVEAVILESHLDEVGQLLPQGKAKASMSAESLTLFVSLWFALLCMARFQIYMKGGDVQSLAQMAREPATRARVRHWSCPATHAPSHPLFLSHIAQGYPFVCYRHSHTSRQSTR